MNGNLNSRAMAVRVISASIVMIFFPLQNLHAQSIVPDDTLGPSEASILRNNRIEGGALRGTNLFHSFREFTIEDGQQAIFSNPDGIANIISRITGNNSSNIRGTLGVDGLADLILINPNGIIFGENAQLDLAGSFIGTSASNVEFSGGGRFSATNPEIPPNLLVVEVPIGLQFGERAESIKISNSQLSVEPGQTLAFLGGDLIIEQSSLEGKGGRIELGSVAPNSQIVFNQVNQGFEFDYSEIEDFRDIDISGNTVVSSREPNGIINIRGEDIDIQDGPLISTATFGSENGGNLTIEASEDLEIQGDVLISTRVEDSPDATGNGGDLLVRAGNITILDGAQLSNSTFSAGDAGNFSIEATDSLKLIDLSTEERRNTDFRPSDEDSNLLIPLPGTFVTGIFTTSGQVSTTERPFPRIASGNGGTLRITASSFEARSSNISTSAFGDGNPGQVEIDVTDLFELRNATVTSEVRNDSNTSVDGGNISISADILLLRQDASISLDNDRVGGRAGNLTIDTNFLIATPLENNDITSNAFFRGSGGLIDLKTESILGIESRDSLTSRSDITAIALSGADGTVTLTSQDIDFTAGLAELPTASFDVNPLIDETCKLGQRLATNRFSRSGLRVQANDQLTIEAQGFLKIEGGIRLTARTAPQAFYGSLSTPSTCGYDEE